MPTHRKVSCTITSFTLCTVSASPSSICSASRSGPSLQDPARSLSDLKPLFTLLGRCIVNASTPSQYFHALRRQVRVALLAPCLPIFLPKGTKASIGRFDYPQRRRNKDIV
jgi:hypothetical protein